MKPRAPAPGAGAPAIAGARRRADAGVGVSSQLTQAGLGGGRGRCPQTGSGRRPHLRHAISRHGHQERHGGLVGDERRERTRHGLPHEARAVGGRVTQQPDGEAGTPGAARRRADGQGCRASRLPGRRGQGLVVRAARSSVVSAPALRPAMPMARRPASRTEVAALVVAATSSATSAASTAAPIGESFASTEMAATWVRGSLELASARTSARMASPIFASASRCGAVGVSVARPPMERPASRRSRSSSTRRATSASVPRRPARMASAIAVACASRLSALVAERGQGAGQLGHPRARVELAGAHRVRRGQRQLAVGDLAAEHPAPAPSSARHDRRPAAGSRPSSTRPRRPCRRVVRGPSPRGVCASLRLSSSAVSSALLAPLALPAPSAYAHAARARSCWRGSATSVPIAAIALPSACSASARHALTCTDSRERSPSAVTRYGSARLSAHATEPEHRGLAHRHFVVGGQGGDAGQRVGIAEPAGGDQRLDAQGPTRRRA
jgi:hypothetical protein